MDGAVINASMGNWDEDFEPYLPFVPVTVAVKEAIGWLRVLLNDNCEGAMLHLLTSMSVFPARDPYHREYLTRPIEHHVLDLMLALSDREQATVLAVAHGYYRPDDVAGLVDPFEDDKTDAMWEAEREWDHMPRHWSDSPTQVEVPFGRWWTTWMEPGEDLPAIPNWVSVEGWHRAAAEAAARR